MTAVTESELTTAEWLSAFAARSYHCHRCGRTDAQTRASDPHPAPLRFRLTGGELLLPRCEHCTPTPHDPRSIAASRLSFDQATNHTEPDHPPGSAPPVSLFALDADLRWGGLFDAFVVIALAEIASPAATSEPPGESGTEAAALQIGDQFRGGTIPVDLPAVIVTPVVHEQVPPTSRAGPSALPGDGRPWAPRRRPPCAAAARVQVNRAGSLVTSAYTP